MRIAILLPAMGTTEESDSSYWTTAIRSLAAGLSAKGIDVAILPKESFNGSGRLSRDLQTACVFEKANEFDLVHGFFNPLFALCAGMTAVPAVLTLNGLTNGDAVSLYKNYNNRIFYVSLCSGLRNSELTYAATVFPGINADDYPFSATPRDHLLCFAHGTGKREAMIVINVAEQAGRRLVFAGSSRDKNRLKKVLPISGNRDVEFVECSSHRDQVEVAGTAYALFCPGGKKFFNPCLFESMASGTPVIFFEGSGLSEFVTPGVTGFSVSSPVQAVESIHEVAHLSRMNCRELTISQFGMNRMVEEYFRLYSVIAETTKKEDRRPWGYYEVISDGERLKVKRIVVYPGKRLSLQRHSYRSEHWHVVSGEAIARCGEEEVHLKKGDSIDIPAMALHRIQNPGTDDLAFIEVQQGDSCSESDIERFEDDFGRV